MFSNGGIDFDAYKNLEESIMDEKFDNQYIIDCILKDEDGFVESRFVMTSEIALCNKEAIRYIRQDEATGQDRWVIGQYRVIAFLKNSSIRHCLGIFDTEEDMNRFYDKVRAKMIVLTTPIAIPSLNPVEALKNFRIGGKK